MSGASGPEQVSSRSWLYSAGEKSTGSSDRKNAADSPTYAIIQYRLWEGNEYSTDVRSNWASAPQLISQHVANE